MTAEPSRILEPPGVHPGTARRMDRLPRTRQPAAAAVDGLLVAASGTPADPRRALWNRLLFLLVLSARPSPFAPISRARARPAGARARLLQARAVFRHLHPRSGLPGQRTIRALPVQRRRGSSHAGAARRRPGRIFDGRAPGELRGHGERRAPPAGPARVHGHVRAQRAKDQRHAGRDRTPRETRHHSARADRRHAAHRRPARRAERSSACSAIGRWARSPCTA